MERHGPVGNGDAVLRAALMGQGLFELPHLGTLRKPVGAKHLDHRFDVFLADALSAVWNGFHERFAVGGWRSVSPATKTVKTWNSIIGYWKNRQLLRKCDSNCSNVASEVSLTFSKRSSAAFMRFIGALDLFTQILPFVLLVHSTIPSFSMSKAILRSRILR